MTITASYVPLQVDVNEDREYAFDFPFAEASDIYVYEIDATGLRFKVPVNDYVLTQQSESLINSSPLAQNGNVVFSRPHREGTAQVRVERNTFMDQTTDFSTFSPFASVMIEFTLDKATMVLQEINDRKCSTAVQEPITQLLQFGSYERIKPVDLNIALNKIYRIAFEIDQSAQDCRPGAEPDDTATANPDDNPYTGNNPPPDGSAVVAPNYPYLGDIGNLDNLIGPRRDLNVPGYRRFYISNADNLVYQIAGQSFPISGPQVRITKLDGTLVHSFGTPGEAVTGYITTNRSYSERGARYGYIEPGQEYFISVYGRQAFVWNEGVAKWEL